MTNLTVSKMTDAGSLAAEPENDQRELEAGCKWALKANVASVCIKPYAVNLAKSILGGSDVKVGTVIGFPQGGHTTEVKVSKPRGQWTTAPGTRHGREHRQSALRSLGTT